MVIEEIKTRTKLTLTDILKPTELYVRKCYCLYQYKIRLLENTGPTGLFFNGNPT